MNQLFKDFGIILIRGAGEHASGTAHRLYRCGFRVVMTEIEQPLAVRRTVSFASAIYDKSITVCGVTARCVETVPTGRNWQYIPVIIDRDCRLRVELQPAALVDARLLKRDIDTRVTDADLVIGLGPGFRAGTHCHAVIETNRGHHLGSVITEGEAEADTGVPGNINGFTFQRCFCAPRSGRFTSDRQIGDRVNAGDILGTVNDVPVTAPLAGILRGLIYPGIMVAAGTKLGDIDPRNRPELCRTLSDKTRTISGGVLEAILAHTAGNL